MKKVGVITVHRTLNYGTMLQMYACSKMFGSVGYDTTIIDYYREHDYKKEDFQSLISYCKKKQRMEKGISKTDRVYSLVKACSTFKDTKKFFEICNDFMDKNLKLSTPYFSYSELEKNPPYNMDVLCAGSDQIWNSDYNGTIDPAFFLGFAEGPSEKISFSSSIGKDKLSEFEKKEFKRFLREFKAISVREEKAQELLQECKVDSTVLLDPTLMLNSSDWSELCSEGIVSKPYLLIYKLKANDEIDKMAYKIAKQKKLSIVRVTFSKLKKKKGETTIVLPTISEFLTLIKNADYVVTNSFHGTCFSINFGRQFSAVPRDKYNSRIVNVLKMLNLNERYCTTQNSFKQQLEFIDYDRVYEILDKKRKESRLWITNAITKH